MPQPFTTLTSNATPLPIENIDTDQVIPARFLKGTSKEGLGENLFADLRYNSDGSAKSEFLLNKPQHQGAQILVAGDNFGCGSSREHAPWALTDYGFRAIIAPSFADIFKNNAMKNQLLPVILPSDYVNALIEAIEQQPALEITIDLAEQRVSAQGFEPQRFEIEPFRKECMLKGLDDIGYTMNHQDDISAYEAMLV